MEGTNPAAPGQRRRGRRWRRSLARFGVAYAIVLVCTFVGCTDRLILFPTRDPIPISTSGPIVARSAAEALRRRTA